MHTDTNEQSYRNTSTPTQTRIHTLTSIYTPTLAHSIYTYTLKYILTLKTHSNTFTPIQQTQTANLLLKMLFSLSSSIFHAVFLAPSCDPSHNQTDT